MSAAGVDDLELDGNWAPQLGNSSAVSLQTESIAQSKTRKRKLVDDRREMSSTAASQDEPGHAGSAKRRKRQQHRKGSFGEQSASGDFRVQACSRLLTAWSVEVKASSLTGLEMKEVTPLPNWFLECSLGADIATVPWQVSAPAGLFAAIQGGAVALPTPTPRCISVLVLCASAERVFQVLQRAEEKWHVKPLALSAHGGGRRKDQVARQARTLATGVSVAVGTPGRLLRLFDDGHAITDGMEAVILDLAADRKQRDLLSLPDTRRDFFMLLRKYLLTGLRKKAARGHKLVMCI